MRVIVDGYGSRPHGEAREMFTQLAASGAQIVVNDVFPLDRDASIRTTSTSTGGRTRWVALTTASCT